MESRIKEIDYLKCVFIILMIVFHLVYIGDKYPYAKQVVYTFHMSGFLVISGYLAGTGKDARSFLRKFLWIFIPYACMEAAYTVMSRFLPVRDGVAVLSPALLLDKIFLHPMGPYWYLHTLILCSLVYYAAFRWCGERLSVASRLVVTGVCLFAVSYWGGVMNFANALYFLLGAVVSRSGLGFVQVFRATPLAVIPLVILCCFPANLDRGGRWRGWPLRGWSSACCCLSMSICLSPSVGFLSSWDETRWWCSSSRPSSRCCPRRCCLCSLSTLRGCCSWSRPLPSRL